MEYLPFTLPSFVRISWASPEAEEAWADRIGEAQEQVKHRWIEAAFEGLLPCVVVPMRPFEVPKLMATWRKTEAKLVILGSHLHERIDSNLLTPHSSGKLYVAIGDPAAVDRTVEAISSGDTCAYLEATGCPDCCRAATIARVTRDPAWVPMIEAPVSSPIPISMNITLRRLGLVALPYVPCRFDCSSSRALGERLLTPGALQDVLMWPMQWSALHGIVEVLTPLFKLVHDTDPSAEKLVVSTLAADVPPETPAGVVFPYPSPRNNPLHTTSSFKRGQQAVADFAAAAIGLEVEQLAVDALDLAPDRPLLLGGCTDLWPARKRWTSEFLRDSFGDVQVTVSHGYQGPIKSVRFDEFLDSVLHGGPLEEWYLIDFGFWQLNHSMLEDYDVPVYLQSWHYLLEPDKQLGLRSLYLGGPGTGTPLHVDILSTSAWNALIWGLKEWVFCPPGSDARLLATQPNLFDQATRTRLCRQGLVVHTCTQRPGDFLFTPSGWWHGVRNVAPSLALTENVVNASNKREVMNALNRQSDHPVLSELGCLLRAAIALGERISTRPHEPGTK